MRVLIYTSSGGTAHDAAAEAIAQWLALRSPEIAVRVEQVESALVQARRDAGLMGARAGKLLQEAEEAAQVSH